MSIVYTPQTTIEVPSLIPDISGQRDPWDGLADRYAEILGDQNKTRRYSSFAERVSRRICSRFNKNAIMSLFGEPGGGKSMAALSLAVGVSRWNAHFLGGEPEDYFTLQNVAVIHPEMLRDMIRGMKRHNIYILDDAGAAYDARKYMSGDNRMLGYVLQTFRTLNGFLIVTSVDGGMLDVNLHRTARYYGEVGSTRHALGYTDLKIFRYLRKFRLQNTHYRYLSQSNDEIAAFRAFLPERKLRDAYEKIRAEQATIIQQMDEEAQKAKEKTKEEKKGPYLSCHICGHGWTYGGKSKRWATCPSCGQKVPTNGLSSTTTSADLSSL
jgi:hypothetical protein